MAICKARLIVKRFSSTYDIDYFETFSPVTRLNSICILFSLIINLEWLMFQFDIKNIFLYSNPYEEVYI